MKSGRSRTRAEVQLDASGSSYTIVDNRSPSHSASSTRRITRLSVREIIGPACPAGSWVPRDVSLGVGGDDRDALGGVHDDGRCHRAVAAELQLLRRRVGRVHRCAHCKGRTAHSECGFPVSGTTRIRVRLTSSRFTMGRLPEQSPLLYQHPPGLSRHLVFRFTPMGPRSLPWRIPVTMDFAETARSFRPPARARWPRAGLAHMIVADHNGEIRALLRAVRRVLPLEVCHQFRIGTEDCD